MKRLLTEILCTGAAGTAVAADTPRFPVKPIRMVVPFGAGGTIHLSAELFKSMTGITMEQRPRPRSGAGSSRRSI